MKVIDKPVTIGAQDMLTAVECSHSGCLMMISNSRHQKMCYCILSQGCIYLYENWFSKKTFLKNSLKDFENVWIQQDELFGKNCFYLGYRDGTTPLHFCCDTEVSLNKWVDMFERDMASLNPSGDSGFGSTGSIHTCKSVIYEDASKNYVEVDEARFGRNHNTKDDQQIPHSEDTESDYENVTFGQDCYEIEGHDTIKRTPSLTSSFCSVSAGEDTHPASQMHRAQENTYPASQMHRAQENSYPASQMHHTQENTHPASQMHRAQENTHPVSQMHRAQENSHPASQMHRTQENSYPASQMHRTQENTHPASQMHRAQENTHPASQMHRAQENSYPASQMHRTQENSYPSSQMHRALENSNPTSQMHRDVKKGACSVYLEELTSRVKTEDKGLSRAHVKDAHHKYS